MEPCKTEVLYSLHRLTKKGSTCKKEISAPSTFSPSLPITIKEVQAEIELAHLLRGELVHSQSMHLTILTQEIMHYSSASYSHLGILQEAKDPFQENGQTVCSESQNSAAFNETSDLLLLLCCFLLTTITEASLLNQLLHN